MEVKVKVDQFDKCATCGHPANHHIARTGRCVVCPLCAQFTPYKPQVIKELRWIFHNATAAKSIEEKQRWLDKLKRWGAAHPNEYNSFQKDLLEELRRR